MEQAILMRHIVSAALRDAPPDQPVLRDVSVTMHRGQCWAIISDRHAEAGELAAIAANMRPYLSGSIRIFGREPKKQKKLILPEIFYFDTDGLLFPSMTVLESLMFCTAAKKEQPVWQRQKELLQLVESLGLGHIALSTVGRLTGTERMPVLLLMAALSDSSILIADLFTQSFRKKELEPLSAVVRLAKSRGKLLLLATHQQELAARCCDHTLCLHEGSVLYAGDTAGGTEQIKNLCKKPEEEEQ